MARRPEMSPRPGNATRFTRPHVARNSPFDSKAIDPSRPYTRDSRSPRSADAVSQEYESVPTAPVA